MVLSKLRIFYGIQCYFYHRTVRTVFRHRDQSPTFSILLAESWIPETNPMILSLKTNIRTAAEAPNPVSNTTGLCFIRILIMMIAPIKKRMTCAVCKKPLQRFVFILFTRAIYQIHSRKQSTDEAKKDCKDINHAKSSKKIKQSRVCMFGERQ